MIADEHKYSDKVDELIYFVWICRILHSQCLLYVHHALLRYLLHEQETELRVPNFVPFPKWVET